MSPQRLVVLIALMVSSLICLAQHRQARETGATQNNSAPSQPSAVPSRSQAPSPSPSPNSSNTSRVDSSSRGGDSHREQNPDRTPKANVEGEDGRSHAKPEPSKLGDKAAAPAGNNQKSAESEKPSSAQSVDIKKIAAECRKNGGILFNGVCVTSIPAAQGYPKGQGTSLAPHCDDNVKQARIAAVQAQLARACGPQGTATACDAAKQELAEARSLPGCGM